MDYMSYMEYLEYMQASNGRRHAPDEIDWRTGRPLPVIEA